MRARPSTFLLCALLLGSAAELLADDKKPDKVEKPEATPEERDEIREQIGKLGRGRHPAPRVAAAGALASFGPKAEAAIPSLVSLLADVDSGLASASASALGKIGTFSAPAVKALVTSVGRARKDGGAVQACAAEALGRIGRDAQAIGAPPIATDAVPALTRALGDESPELRRDAAAALGWLGEKARAQLPALKARLADPDAAVKLAAATSCARLGDASPELVATLREGASAAGRRTIELRESSCQALGLLGAVAAPAVPTLIEVLGEQLEVNPALPYPAERRRQHEAMRCAAATALGAIGAREAIQPLTDAASEPMLKAACEAALAKLR